ncbi:MAG: G8 domain-containing protein, partial [Thermosynechococcaceae cyanobacterium]
MSSEIISMSSMMTDDDHSDTDLPHPHNPGQQSEHLALLDLVPHHSATHIAVNNGSWFDPHTWSNGQVPNDGAQVLIKAGITVNYDAESETRLFTLRVDGLLNFATDRNTKMFVDTFIVAPDGTLQIGTADQSVQADYTAKIIFTGDQPIDTDWDPKQLSRGLISHGHARIYGAEKLDFISLAQDALAGDNELRLKLPDGMTQPEGWRVGDQLVLGGTYYSYGGSYADNSRFHDEVLTMTSIEGDRIRFTNSDITSGDNTRLRFN